MTCPGASERCVKPENGLQQTILECNITKYLILMLKDSNLICYSYIDNSQCAEESFGNIMKAQGRQKVYYDQVHCKDREKYKAGTLVLIKNSKKLSKKGSRMEPNWTAPILFMKSCLKVSLSPICHSKSKLESTT